jgi:uncharacterized membrane protein YeaQ/YmgE (transglycosylase-associated protein family)
LRVGHRHDVVDWGELFMGILSIIGTIVVGLIVGVLARSIFPTAVPLGFWLTVGLGIGGSVVGGVIADLFLRSPDGKLHPAGWLLSIAGAVLLLWGYTKYMM